MFCPNCIFRCLPSSKRIKSLVPFPGNKIPNFDTLFVVTVAPAHYSLVLREQLQALASPGDCVLKGRSKVPGSQCSIGIKAVYRQGLLLESQTSLGFGSFHCKKSIRNISYPLKDDIKFLI